MHILAIDPGTTKSAWVSWNTTDQRVMAHGIESNERLLDRLGDSMEVFMADVVVIEQIESYGKPVGVEVFATVFWCGRFAQRVPNSFELVPRRAVKRQLCNSVTAKDSHVRQALIDRFGGKASAIGTKKAPGPLYGIKADEWSALALAVTWPERDGYHVEAQ